jgi:ribosome-binding factor A
MANPRTIARLSARIHERAAYCLQFEINDPRASFITITRVELTPDVTAGKIFYSVLGSEADKSKAQHMLDSAAGFIQRQVARVLDMRRMPHLKWVYDDSVQRASDLDAVIREARARDRAINPSVDESGAIADAAAVEAPAIDVGDDGDTVDGGDDEEDGNDEETR